MAKSSFNKNLKREFFKFLLLTQCASDAGKGFVSANPKGSGRKAIEAGYEHKDLYLANAIRLAEKLPDVTVGISADGGMCVVLFDIRGIGQVSFHTFGNFYRRYTHLVGRVEWNEIVGGSVRVCRYIVRKYNLPFCRR